MGGGVSALCSALRNHYAAADTLMPPAHFTRHFDADMIR